MTVQASEEGLEQHRGSNAGPNKDVPANLGRNAGMLQIQSVQRGL